MRGSGHGNLKGIGNGAIAWGGRMTGVADPASDPALGPGRHGVGLRPAGSEDVDALKNLEDRCFETDRLSRRSFRRFIAAGSATCLVAEGPDGEPAGYALVIYRAGTALGRLYSIAVAPPLRGRGCAGRLLAAAEEAAFARGCVELRLEVRADNAAAIALYRARGYREFGRFRDYYEDHEEAVRLRKRLNDSRRAERRTVPYYRQTTEFTCGPAAMMMAMAELDPALQPDRSLELRLWREATTIYMTAGHGGCDPVGMAVALARRGFAAEVFVNREGPLFLDGVRDPAKQAVMVLAQEDFRAQAGVLGVTIRGEALAADSLTVALDEGALALVLVSHYRMVRSRAPHWVLVYGHDGRLFYLHDPWVEDEAFETEAAAADLPVPKDEFDRMACYGEADRPGFAGFSRLLFDWFRAPILEVTVEAVAMWWRLKKLRAVPMTDLKGETREWFLARMNAKSQARWRSPKARVPARYALAVLCNAKESLPPSKEASLRHFARIAERLSIEVEPIAAKDLARLAGFDALWIRETTAIDNHTYRFARRAVQEGMPVIDDPVSILRCTNKVYLAERLTAAEVPIPRTLTLAEPRDAAMAEAALGYPVVLKIPDGSFSRGVKKADNRADLDRLLGDMFDDSDLVLAQAFMPTAFDWRIGVLAGEPLYACQYLMAPKHWQIVRHRADGRPVEGGFRSVALADAPPAVIETAVRGARLVGDGLYGVDLKETDRGVFLIEIKDNPNLDHGIEDQAEKDMVWERLARWFLDRLR